MAWPPGAVVRLLGAGTFDGPYTVLETRVGGMGVVYIARHHGDGSIWALKSTPPGPTAEVAERFRREAELWVRLGYHPHIVHAYICARFLAEATGAWGDEARLLRTPVIVTEFVAGGSLADRIAQGPVPSGEVFRLATEVCLGMEYFEQELQRHGIEAAHRDLKPANVVLMPPPNVYAKVTDFGLARAFQGASPLAPDGAGAAVATSVTATGSIAGSPAYMPPEQFRDLRAAGVRADIYSFGVTLFEMLTGRRPFEASTVGEFAHLHAHVPPPPTRELAPQVPPYIESAIARCLQKRPEDRFGSFGELREALGGGARRAPAAPTSATPAAPRSPAQTLALADSLASIGRGAADREGMRRLMEGLQHVTALLSARGALPPQHLADACHRVVRWSYPILTAFRDGRASAEEAQWVLAWLQAVLLEYSLSVAPQERTRLFGTVRHSYGLVWPGGPNLPRPGWLDEYLARRG